MTGITVPVEPLEGLVFNIESGPRIPYTCTGRRLLIFKNFRVRPFTFHRLALDPLPPADPEAGDPETED